MREGADEHRRFDLVVLDTQVTDVWIRSRKYRDNVR